MGVISGGHIFYLIIFLVIVLIIFGPGKLPDIGAGLGKAIREFRHASAEVRDSVTTSVAKDEPAKTEPRPAPSGEETRTGV